MSHLHHNQTNHRPRTTILLFLPTKATSRLFLCHHLCRNCGVCSRRWVRRCRKSNSLAADSSCIRGNPGSPSSPCLPSLLDERKEEDGKCMRFIQKFSCSKLNESEVAASWSIAKSKDNKQWQESAYFWGPVGVAVLLRQIAALAPSFVAVAVPAKTPEYWLAAFPLLRRHISAPARAVYSVAADKDVSVLLVPFSSACGRPWSLSVPSSSQLWAPCWRRTSFALLGALWVPYAVLFVRLLLSPSPLRSWSTQRSTTFVRRSEGGSDGSKNESYLERWTLSDLSERGAP